MIAVTLIAADARATLRPDLGANCVAWQVMRDGRPVDLLYAPPDAELAQRPTRGGVPVLCPFPNRIRGGRFTWDGREYQLPLNDSAGANAIHGFTPRRPWQILAVGSSAATMEFVHSRDADAPGLWPADYRCTLTVTLTPDALTYDIGVENVDAVSLPLGVGLHPYFACGPDDRVTAPASARWELDGGLPTGRILEPDAAHDLQTLRRVGGLQLDDVYTGLSGGGFGELRRADGLTVRVAASADFRELVAFTPPHGKAVCLEPYTCPTDAVNLAAAGRDVGWRVVPPGGQWAGRVAFTVGPAR